MRQNNQLAEIPLRGEVIPARSSLFTPKDLHHYQHRAVRHLVRHPHAMLHLDMGLGKTIITLTAISYLQEIGAMGPVLVAAPLRVAEGVWPSEVRKWTHTRHLRVSPILGTPEERMRGLFTPADIYTINYENLQWLQAQLEHFWLRQGKYPPFSTIVWDEVDKMKDAGSVRVGVVRRLIPFIERRIGLTGTPSAAGLTDLHGQYLVVDAGRRLGTSKSLFEQTYFEKKGYKWVPRPTTMGEIVEAVSDITLEMRASDYIDMPELVINDVWVELPPRAREIYEQVEKDFFAELDSGAEIVLSNEGSKINKCLQIANGAAFLVPGEPEYEVLHQEKQKAWDEIRSSIGDSPLLTSYVYRFDYQELQKRHPDVVNLTTAPARKTEEIQEAFNTGKIRDLIGHPASIGHGLNLQRRANQLAMIGVPWSLRQYQQFIARLCRQGQKKKTVILHRILAKDTLDEAVLGVLANNNATQETFRDAVQAYRDSRIKR